MADNKSSNNVDHWADLYRHTYTTWNLENSSSKGKKPKYSWVEGLSNCPKCNEDVTDCNWYCSQCSYGEKERYSKKPPKVKGYVYVKDKDNPGGKYFRIPDKNLFKSVILESYKKQQILEALSMVQHKDKILNDWGFHQTLEKGFGTSFLFHGKPGTGKTLMAQAIADYLGKPLKVFTAADILDKYVGEAERKIKEAFTENDDAVLLFDECDSLLYSRENARSSYQISEVNTLLNYLENFTGVSIFTTNYIAQLDKAFDRRIALKMQFDLPTKELRVDIWKRMFPKIAPLDKDIEWELLADYELAGGHIKNAVLRALRITVHAGFPTITNKVLKEALKQELESMVDYVTDEVSQDEKIKEQIYEHNK